MSITLDYLKLLLYKWLVLTFQIKCALLLLFLAKETRIASHLFAVNDGDPKDKLCCYFFVWLGFVLFCFSIYFYYLEANYFTIL